MSKKVVLNSFSYLGNAFQKKLIAQLIVDEKFARRITPIIDPNFFEGNDLIYLVGKFKDAYIKEEVHLNYDSFVIRINQDTALIEEVATFYKNSLKNIGETDCNDCENVKTTALYFCKQQALRINLKKIQVIVERGKPEEYPDCEKWLKEALELGNEESEEVDATDNCEDVLSDDFRKPIPTGITGLDECMDGGISKSELGVILAPYGVGKSTMMTIMANTAKNLGYNVLQIFFEDTVGVIKRKHYIRWFNLKHKENIISLNDIKDNKDELRNIVNQQKDSSNKLMLVKLHSDGITIPKIKQYLRKLISKGFKPDIIFLDYIDCVTPHIRYDDVNIGEGSVMRAFESMLAEFEIAGWTAVQGNRASIGAEIVEGNQMGGSIKRGQIGHFVCSVAKTLEQKETGTATLAILKSRFGKDGIVFRDIIFNNGTMIIDTTKSGISFLDNKNEKIDRGNKRVAALLDEKKNSILKNVTLNSKDENTL